MERSWEITWAGLWRILGMLILVSIFYVALDIWVAVLLAIVISSALDPSVTWLENKKIPRVIGSLGIFIFLILVIALLLYTVVPTALSELNILLKNFGKIETPAFGLSGADRLINLVNKSLDRATSLLFSGNVSFLDIISRFLGSLAMAAAVFVLSFYLTVDRAGVEKFLIEVMPTGYEEKTLEVYFRTRQKIGSWLYGQLFLSLSVGVAAFIGLWFIGVKYNLILGILAGVLEIVPFAGPILSGSIAFILAVSESWNAGIYVFLLFVLIQQMENIVLTPVFMKLTTSLHPAAVLISLLVGGRLLGLAGLILAVPIAVALQEMMESWSNEKQKRKAALPV